MSKKTSPKKKVTLKIAPGQAAFVADLKVLEHIARTYISFGDSEQDDQYKQYWYGISKEISEWTKETYNPIEEGYEDEESW
jgi:hypothetical protein